MSKIIYCSLLISGLFLMTSCEERRIEEADSKEACSLKAENIAVIESTQEYSVTVDGVYNNVSKGCELTISRPFDLMK